MEHDSAAVILMGALVLVAGIREAWRAWRPFPKIVDELSQMTDFQLGMQYYMRLQEEKFNSWSMIGPFSAEQAFAALCEEREGDVKVVYYGGEWAIEVSHRTPTKYSSEDVYNLYQGRQRESR